MAIPVGVPRVTLSSGRPMTGPGGTVRKGHFLFTGPDLVTIAGQEYTLGGSEPAYLVDGVLTVDLVPQDVPTMNPDGWSYTVTAVFADGETWERQMLLSVADTGTVLLSDKLTPDPATPNYVPVPGPPGADGAPGSAGAKGDPGASGAAGAQGADGRSAYEVAVADGFVGTEAAWLASLKGPKGDPGGGASAGVSNDGRINEEIITLSAAAGWTIVTTSGGTEIGKSIAAAVGQRVRFSPSFLRTGGVVFLDIGIKAAAGGVSRYISSGTSTPRDEGYAPLYPLSQFVGVAGIREFIVQAGEIDGSGNVTIVLAYKGAADGNQRLYFGGGYDGAVWVENPDA